MAQYMKFECCGALRVRCESPTRPRKLWKEELARETALVIRLCIRTSDAPPFFLTMLYLKSGVDVGAVDFPTDGA